MTVTLEIRHPVIPDGFVRACARREHPPSSTNHFPATIISGCHDRPAQTFLPRIPSSFNSAARYPLRELLVLSIVLARDAFPLSDVCACVPEAIYHTLYSVHRCKYRPLSPCSIVLFSLSLSLLVFDFSIKERGKLSPVNFGRGSARFDSHATQTRKRLARAM